MKSQHQKNKSNKKLERKSKNVKNQVIEEEESVGTFMELFKIAKCGSNDFQDYFDDAKESRVKQVPKNQESKSFKNQVSKNQDSRIIKFQESRFKTQDSKIKRRLNQDKY